MGLNIAVVGGGISGLAAAYLLSQAHTVTVFEAADRPGGHTNTIDVAEGSETRAVDTGFIVFNDWTYPQFIRLLARLGVESIPSSMSFSVRSEASGLEYNGTSLNTLFGQRRNLLRPRFWGMIRDILRFHREAPRLLEETSASALSLGDVLRRGGYGQAFCDEYIVPMGAAIWSSDPARLLRFPARFFIRFFHNHGMLSVDRRPTWRVIKGGSKQYVARLIEPFQTRLRLGHAVSRIVRRETGVTVVTERGTHGEFDRVVVGCAADRALAMLEAPTAAEAETLACFDYQANHALLHQDASIMPRRRRVWASWNYHLAGLGPPRLAVTYWMNELQRFQNAPDYFVTLNRAEAIDPRHVLYETVYRHPVFTPMAIEAQRRWAEVSSHATRTFYCGAYWGYGFHEDGVSSALAVAHAFDLTL